MLIREVTDITRATPHNRVYDPAKKDVEELADDLHEEDEADEKADSSSKSAK